MKKLHGTHSIQPLTITDAVVAEDAQIAESKIALTYTTTELNDYASSVDQRLSAHEATSSDPHGQILTQTTIRSEDIQSAPSPVQQTITVSNSGDGNVLLEIDGDIKADNATLDGDVNISGVTSIGGQTHISGSVVIDGDLTVVGTTTKVESETIDYDSLLVTPSSATNHTGIIVAPDGTGFTGEGQPQTTTETITVHDDIVDTGWGYMGAPIRALSNGDLIVTLGNRVVKTNPEATEIKATYHVEGGYVEEIVGAAINSSDEISIIVGNSSNYGVPDSPYSARRDDFRIVTLDSDLEFIRESGILFEGRDPALIYPTSFEYNNGKYYALYDFTDGSYGLCIYNETYIDANSGEESPNNFIHCTEYHDVSGLHSEESLSSIGVYAIAPFTHNDQDYIFIIGCDNMFVVDDNMHLQGYEMWDSTDENYDRYACMDVTSSGAVDPINKMFYTVGYSFFVYGFPITYFLNADTYISELEVIRENTISTIPVMFDNSFSSVEELMNGESEVYGGQIRGVLSDGTVLYFSEDSHNLYWLNPDEFGNTTLEAFDEQEDFALEFSPGLEADFVTHVRRFVVTAEDEAAANSGENPGEPEEVDPFVMDPDSDPLSSYGLDNYGAFELTTDLDGNFYFVGVSDDADCITKVDAETLSSVSIRIYNVVTGGTYMFGEHGVFGVGISADKSAAYISCSSMLAETGPTAIYRYDLRTGICDPSERQDAYLQGGFVVDEAEHQVDGLGQVEDNYARHFKNIWFHSYAVDYENNRMVLIGGTTNQENDIGGILILDYEDYSTIKYIQISSVHSFIRNDRGCVQLCVSPDGDYAYVLEYYTDDGFYNSPRKTAVNKIPLNTEATSYDPATSPDCVRIALYGTEDIAAYGYPVSIKITPEGRLFVATVSGHIFELDPDTLEILDESDIISSAEKEARYELSGMAVNSNTMLVSYVNYDNSWDIENYGLRAYDISDDTSVSNATVIESVPYDGPTPAAPGNGSEEEPEEPEEPEESEEDACYGRDLIRTTTQEVSVESLGDTFLGNLLELQTRTRGLNEAAVIVDRSGNLNILKGDVTIQGNKLGVTANGINFNSDITVPSVTTTDKGFIYKANSAATPGSTVISCKNSHNNNLFTVGGNGNTSVGGTLTLGGASDPIYYDDNEYGTQADVAFTNDVVTLDDSILTLASGNNTPWKIFNAHSSVSFYFGVQNAPKFEISENEVTIAQTNTSLQNLAVHGTSSFAGDVTVALNATVDGVDIGIHDHSGVAGHGERIPATSVIGLQEFLDGHMETVQDYVGGMVSSNTERGIAVTYDDNSGKLNFDVNDFTITAAGNVSGSTTVTNLGNSTFTMTVLDSDKVDGLHVTSGAVNNEANKVVKTDASGHTKCGWINTTSGNASTATMDRVYASYDGYIRYYTPANFATQILALGGTVKNSHVHDKVNNLKPMRGSSTFNGTTGRVVMLPAAFANTNYTVAVTPTANTNGQLGDVWVSKSTDRFTVYNTGTATVAFDYIAIG